MYAVIGRVKIKPGHEQETLAMIEKSGVAMVSGFPVRVAVIGRTQLMVKTSSSTRSGCSMAKRVLALQRRHLRAMPDAPATLISVEVCEVVGLGVAHRQPPKRASRAESGAVGRLWRQPARAVNAHFPYPAAGLPRAAGPCRED